MAQDHSPDTAAPDDWRRDVDSRQLVVIAGEPPWCYARAGQLVHARAELSPGVASRWLMLGASDPAFASLGVEFVDRQRAGKHLGGECDNLLIDAHHGLPPNALAALVGTVRAAGLVVLLAPPLDGWNTIDDCDYDRITPHPKHRGDLGRFFWQRLRRIYLHRSDVTIYDQSTKYSRHPELIAGHWAAVATHTAVHQQSQYQATPDQQRAIDAVLKTAQGHRRRPTVILAPRGRGKSVALALATRILMEDGKRVCACAPSRDALASFFDAVTDTASRETLSWFTIEALLQQRPACDLLIIDEAAALPEAQLEACLRHYPRVALASTTDGYEGTGRGFALRLQPRLTRLTSGWRSVTLTHPIRWPPGDRVEDWLNELLLLDCATQPAGPPAQADAAPAEIRRLTQRELFNDEPLLRQVYALLVNAHYRTTPEDLRLLLDGANLHLVTAHADDQVIGVAAGILEGSIEPELQRPIWLGQRRLRGHLLPQILAQGAGFAEASALAIMRVQRIAVTHEYRRQGVATALLDTLADVARDEQCHAIGSSFATAPDVISFWRRQAYKPVHVGHQRNRSTGTHNVVYLRALAVNAAQLIAQLQQRCLEQLHARLHDDLQWLDSRVAIALLRQLPTTSQLSNRDWQDLRAYVEGHRDLKTLTPSLNRWLIDYAQIDDDDPQFEALFALHVQHRGRNQHLPASRRQWLTQRISAMLPALGGSGMERRDSTRQT